LVEWARGARFGPCRTVRVDGRSLNLGERSAAMSDLLSLGILFEVGVNELVHQIGHVLALVAEWFGTHEASGTSAPGGVKGQRSGSAAAAREGAP
jgi:hypothetical protein